MQGNYVEKLEESLINHFNKKIKVKILVDEVKTTPAIKTSEEKSKLLKETESAMMKDGFVKDLIESFEFKDTYDYLMYIKRIEKKFSLQKEDSESYMKAREYYNSLPLSKRDPRLLYTILLYGFNQQLRFNNNHEFNNPVGMRWFNDKVLEKFVSFSRVIKEKAITIENEDYSQLEIPEDNTFVYLDPPYMMTTGSYNDGKRGFKGWNSEEENRLLKFLEKLNYKGINFMLSYVVEHKGEVNTNIIQWVKKNKFRLIELSGYPGIKRKEVIIINYEK